jgi:hypothetical protein
MLPARTVGDEAGGLLGRDKTARRLGCEIDRRRASASTCSALPRGCLRKGPHERQRAFSGWPAETWAMSALCSRLPQHSAPRSLWYHTHDDLTSPHAAGAAITGVVQVVDEVDEGRGLRRITRRWPGRWWALRFAKEVRRADLIHAHALNPPAALRVISPARTRPLRRRGRTHHLS